MLHQFATRGGIQIECEETPIVYEGAIEPLVSRLDGLRGGVFASGFEFPGRYTSWDIGFCNPPLCMVCQEKSLRFEALNQRGEVLLAILTPLFESCAFLRRHSQTDTQSSWDILPGTGEFCEEARSRQPSVFEVLRVLLAHLFTEEDACLGFYGAFGYDLVFQFEQITKKKPRDAHARDLVLYFPDEIIAVDHRREVASVRRYEFRHRGKSTQGLARDGDFRPWVGGDAPDKEGDHAPGEYAAVVSEAKTRFARGDLFEVVPSQTFYATCKDAPSALFTRMRRQNPSPYGFFLNLGEGEYLVGASPEMYVRVTGRRVETCPISGTIRRGSDAIEDAHNIETLLASPKEASELTMCTDVDRNDKSRVCEPDSVRVIGRRQIEMYSRVIHTVDHVEGTLRKEFDAVDAFLSHMWVVTVTGAPKLWAMQFIEDHEKSPRRWYAGAVGWFGVNGNLNTGLVLRTVRVEGSRAEIRTGATLLFDSDPAAEEQETRLKASAFIEMLQSDTPPLRSVGYSMPQNGCGKRVLLVDHEDSFVHTLANYLRQTGADVQTVRYQLAESFLKRETFDWAVLSPGPGRPSDFKLDNTIALALEKNVAIFGVCLGLQGIVEYFGGRLGVLDYPVHGKASIIRVLKNPGLFDGLGTHFTAGRYHSLHATDVPDVLEVTAETEEGIVMGVSHRTLPVHALQFHPETILSLKGAAGLRIMGNLFSMKG